MAQKAGYAQRQTPPDNGYAFQSAQGSGVYEIPVGPIHAGIIEPGHFRFLAVGEHVLNLEERLGYVHKGIEKIAEGRVWLEGQMRWDDNWDHGYQGMARAALGYSLSDRATVWMGYTFLPTQNVGKPYIAQQDMWPAFRYVLPTDYGTLTFRTMWESNFPRGSQIRERPRQMIRFTHSLDFEPRLSLVAWDEVFVRVNNTEWGGKSGFDQNRAFLGLGWTFNPNFRTEFGYLSQYLDDANHVNTTLHHLIMGSLFINF